MNYCGDCGHYIPGGVEENCRIRFSCRKTSTCPLREACENFIHKDEMEKETEFPKINLRKPRKRKRI